MRDPRYPRQRDASNPTRLTFYPLRSHRDPLVERWREGAVISVRHCLGFVRGERLAKIMLATRKMPSPGSRVAAKVIPPNLGKIPLIRKAPREMLPRTVRFESRRNRTAATWREGLVRT